MKKLILPILGIALFSGPAFANRFIARPSQLVSGSALSPVASVISKDLTLINSSLTPGLATPNIRELQIYSHALTEMSNVVREGAKTSVAVPFFEYIPGRSMEEKLEKHFSNDQGGRIQNVTFAIKRLSKETSLEAKTFLAQLDPFETKQFTTEEEAQARYLLARFEYISDEKTATRLADAILTRKSQSSGMNLSKSFAAQKGLWDQRRMLLDTMTGRHQEQVGIYADALEGPGASAQERGILTVAEAQRRFGRKETKYIPVPGESAKVLPFNPKSETRDIDFALTWLESYFNKSERPPLDRDNLEGMLDIIHKYADKEGVNSGWFPLERFGKIVNRSVENIRVTSYRSLAERSDAIFIAGNLVRSGAKLSVSSPESVSSDWYWRLGLRLNQEMHEAERVERSLNGMRQFWTLLSGVATTFLTGLATMIAASSFPAFSGFFVVISLGTIFVVPLGLFVFYTKKFITPFSEKVAQPLRDATAKD